LSPWCRKSPKNTEVLPLLYLHGLSSGDFVPALGQFLGSPRQAVGGGDHPADRATEIGAPRAKKALVEIWGAEGKDHACAAVKAFDVAYGAKFPKAAAKITDDFGGHWEHLRTTNPIKSTFATVRHPTKVTKGPGSRAPGLAMAFKLIESAQDRWARGQHAHLVALVRAGATFINGKLVERADDAAA
jgi:hypothetical protein